MLAHLALNQEAADAECAVPAVSQRTLPALTHGALLHSSAARAPFEPLPLPQPPPPPGRSEAVVSVEAELQAVALRVTALRAALPPALAAHAQARLAALRPPAAGAGEEEEASGGPGWAVPTSRAEALATALLHDLAALPDHAQRLQDAAARLARVVAAASETVAATQ